MPRRIRPTHRLTVRRFGSIECGDDTDCPDGATCSTEGVCVDELGEPIQGEQVVLEGVPARYDPEAETVRDEEGAVIRHMPELTLAGDYTSSIEETDDVDLEPLASSGKSYEGLDVRSVDPVHGRRAAPSKTAIGLEG